jgi:uncharacterized membrane protein
MLFSLDIAILLAALGITTLELVEAAAVGLALYGESKRPAAFLAIIAGTLVVFIPMFLVGALIALLPAVIVRLVGGVLLLYFGLRLVRSARKSVLRSRKHSTFVEHFEKGIIVTGFSVGAVEAFEAAIVLVGLLPNNYGSTVLGMATGIIIVIVATYALRNQVRRVKQANMKIFVSALLLSFATFWFGEVITSLNDLLLIAFSAFYAFVVHKIANRPSPEIVVTATGEAGTRADATGESAGTPNVSGDEQQTAGK